MASSTAEDGEHAADSPVSGMPVCANPVSFVSVMPGKPASPVPVKPVSVEPVAASPVAVSPGKLVSVEVAVSLVSVKPWVTPVPAGASVDPGKHVSVWHVAVSPVEPVAVSVCVGWAPDAFCCATLAPLAASAKSRWWSWGVG